MSLTVDHLPMPTAIVSYLDTLVARQRKLSLWQAIGRALAISILWMTTCAIVDRIVHMPSAIRLILLLINMALVIKVLAIPFWRWVMRPVDIVAASEFAERLDPALGGRLSTATSRMLGPSSYRGSTVLLDQVVADATSHVAGRDPIPLLPTRLIARPWYIAAGAFFVVIALLLVPWLGMPRLIVRYVLPLANIAAVTTTRLNVTPGSTTIAQAKPLTVIVQGERLGDDVPRVHLSTDGANWSRFLMTASDGGFVYRSDPLGQDARYFVTGGDAKTETFDVRVLRTPLATDFRVRYVYPKYMNRQPLTVANKTGLIEAPVGTVATLTVTVSEPLSSGTMRVADKTIELTQTLDDHARQASVNLEKDGTYSLQLTSNRGAASDSTTAYPIRALPDRPPLARLADSATGARPGPRDMLPVVYQALDDYGVDAVAVVAKVNGGEPVRIALKVRGDQRSQEETYSLDLAPLNVNVGDVVTVVVEARDGKGQSTTSDPMSALVSPRAIDLNAHQRVIELEAARSIADGLVKRWEGAQRAFDAAAGKPVNTSEHVATITDANRSIAGASESSAVLRQSLLRAMLRSRSNEMSVALSFLLDEAQKQLDTAERLVGTRGPLIATAKQPMSESLEAARRVRDALTVIATGERAAAVDAERENVAAVTARAADPAYPAALKQGVKRLSDDFAGTLRSLGIDPGAGDVPDQLKRRVDAAEAFMRTVKAVDFAAASGAWSRDIAVPHKPTRFDARLATAAQAEAIRPDADLLRARDLQVSSEAATRIEGNQVAPATRPTDPLPRDLYPASLLGLQRFHETNRPMDNRPSSDEIEQRKVVAAEGRRRMSHWAGLDATSTNGDAFSYASNADDLEMLAMTANAAAAERDYRTASKIDRQMANGSLPHRQRDPDEMPNGLSRVERTMAAAERIDQLAAEQQALAEETKLANAAGTSDIAERQNDLTDAIADVQRDVRLEVPARNVDDPDWREDATAAIQAAQEQLAAVPQVLSATIRADLLRQEAAAQVERVRASATTAPPELKPAMTRAAEQGERDLLQAKTQVTTTAAPVQPIVAERMSARLAAYVPQTKSSVTVIDQQLLPALRGVAQAIDANDGGSLERSTKVAFRAIEAVQTELARAQDALIERDPLVAAKWFARAAAKSLTERPPDLIAAERHQRVASAALTRAWDRSIHQAANERLAGVPSMMSVFSFFPVAAEGQGSGGGDVARRIMSLVPAVREWGLVRPDGATQTDAVRRDVDPPGYEEPIRLYFETLGKTKAATK